MKFERLHASTNRSFWCVFPVYPWKYNSVGYSISAITKVYKTHILPLLFLIIIVGRGTSVDYHENHTLIFLLLSNSENNQSWKLVHVVSRVLLKWLLESESTTNIVPITKVRVNAKKSLYVPTTSSRLYATSGLCGWTFLDYPESISSPLRQTYQAVLSLSGFIPASIPFGNKIDRWARVLCRAFLPQINFRLCGWNW